jgi:hypothetical protein
VLLLDFLGRGDGVDLPSRVTQKEIRKRNGDVFSMTGRDVV